LASVSRHRAGVRATVPAVQVREECSYGKEEEEGLFKALPNLSVLRRQPCRQVS